MRFQPDTLTVHHDPAEAAKVCWALRSTGRRVVLVPTMGALHAGHLELVRHAKRVPGAVVVVSIFVNPLQFAAGEDLDAYPRTLDSDVELLRQLDVPLVFAPSPQAMYPAGVGRTSVQPGPLGAELEGAARPTHFAGVLTVVAKLFAIIAPHVAFFGEKDYQQLTLIRHMAADLNLGVRVAGVPTVREPDGLALSSRNVYLQPEQRAAAVALSAALVAGAHAGGHGGAAVLRAAHEVVQAEPGVALDYLELRSNELGPPPEQGAARLLIAAMVGSTRLLDNVGVTLGATPSTATAHSEL